MTKANQTSRRQFILVASASALPFAWTNARAEASVSVLFICEHGYAKSLVAARHFERMAVEHGLRVHALSRGVDPGARVPQTIEAGLAADGFDVGAFAPSPFTTAEIQQSDYLVLISVVPDLGGRTGPVLRWDDISPLSEDYDRARRQIVAHAALLLQRIQSDTQARS